MTPQEKANELMSKFVGISLSQVNELVDGIRLRLAKESALIAIEEIKNVTAPYCDRHEDYYQKLKETEKQEYWQQVKAEIEKL